jgi:hypothetical protein
MKEERKSLFSEKVSAGSRTYFFDVKESVKGTKSLVVTESKKVGETHERSRILVFDDGLGPFTEGLLKAVKFVQGKPAD